ncbi:hypothetical protein Tco_0654804 [Tanacetum coccineum]|uniref:Uncharacterized protein n=1 Tax=Tanacetum coccineum TaxID=301880 RepID=A0ABQ4X4V5_9ASTR
MQPSNNLNKTMYRSKVMNHSDATAAIRQDDNPVSTIKKKTLKVGFRPAVQAITTPALKSFNGLLSPTSAADVRGLDANDVEFNGSKTNIPKKINFRSIVNDEKVENSNTILPRAAIDKVKKDGLSLIATQIGKPLMLDAYTTSMCGEAWRRINFAHALIEVSSESDLKKEVTMAVPNDDETDYTRGESLVWNTNGNLQGVPIIKILVTLLINALRLLENRSLLFLRIKSDRFTEVKRKKHKDKKADMHPRSRQIEGIRLDKPKPNFYWQKKSTTRRGADMDTTAKNKVKVEDQDKRHKVSLLNEHIESDDEVDEFIFPEGDKFGDKFDIRLKGRGRK